MILYYNNPQGPIDGTDTDHQTYGTSCKVKVY